MKTLKKKAWMLGVLTTLLILSCSRNNDVTPGIGAYSNAVVLQWNTAAYQAFGGTQYQHSLMASRINAMVHLAMHDALNAVHPKYATYAFTGKDQEAHPVAAAASAAHAILMNEIPGKESYLDSMLQQSLSTIADGDAKTSGIELGKQAAQTIIALRVNDGSDANPVVPVPASDVLGAYQAVPPFDFYFAPYWENVKLFGLERKDQFRCPPPPAMTSAEYTEAFIEVKAYGELNSNMRSVDQTAFAQYWYEFSEAGWNRVTQIAAANKNLGLLETARLFALVDIAMADAYIAGWDSKLHYNFWRPYTAIRNAASDGNPLTIEDLDWEPLLPTPPIQDHPSTHSALGNAAATVLANVLGDNTPFTMPSPTAVPAGGTKSFTSFSQAAQENADSRVIAGIHFRFACDAGLEMGKQIGDWVTDHQLKEL